uniref:G-protein coupled receptors family 1 profile domain-containing protein n=1 Tax=Plectus sambesii TaxID=2011161 RepID=A0A914V0N6_9BILA
MADEPDYELEYSNDTQPCFYPLSNDYDKRYYLIVFFGGSMAVLSMLENLLIFIVLVIRGEYRRNHFAFFTFMAPFDVFVSLAYVLLFCAEIVVQYWQVVQVQQMWWTYFRCVYMGSHFSLTAGTFLLVAASFERYLFTCKPHLIKPIQRNRIAICCMLVLLSFLLKSSTFFEFELARNDELSNGAENCTGLMEYFVEPSVLIDPRNNTLLYILYGVVYRVYIRQIASSIIPFTALAYFNVMIILKFRHHHRTARLFRTGSSEHKIRARAVTRMLFITVCSYLLANVPNMMLIIWEYIDVKSLIDYYPTFYVWMADTVSICHVLCAVVRLPIFLLYNAEMREAFACLCGQSSNSGVYRLHDSVSRIDSRPLSLIQGPLSTLATGLSNGHHQRRSTSVDSVESMSAIAGRVAVHLTRVRTNVPSTYRTLSSIELMLDNRPLRPGDTIPVQIITTHI